MNVTVYHLDFNKSIFSQKPHWKPQLANGYGRIQTKESFLESTMLDLSGPDCKVETLQAVLGRSSEMADGKGVSHMSDLTIPFGFEGGGHRSWCWTFRRGDIYLYVKYR